MIGKEKTDTWFVSVFSMCGFRFFSLVLSVPDCQFLHFSGAVYNMFCYLRTAKKPCEFHNGIVFVKFADHGADRTVFRFFFDKEVSIRGRGDLRQMGDADDLAVLCQSHQR